MDDGSLRLFDQLAEGERESLATTFEERHRTLEQCGGVMRETLRVTGERGWKTHQAIWNPCLFLNTVDYDLSILIHDLAYERDEWRRRFVARSLALVLFEIAEDVPAVFGKGFRLALRTLHVPVELTEALDVHTKSVAAHWGEHRVMLKSIRTAAAAHRDHDAIKLLDTIEQLDLLGLLGIGLELGRMLNDLGSAAQAILAYTSSVEPPELSRGSS